MIVDDEPLARQRIRLLLEQEVGVEIVGECENGQEAVEQVRKLLPDLLFLDVQLPGMDGFQVLEEIGRNLSTVVIFTTAYEQHALRAFEARAMDYLLKPFKIERFKDAVARARSVIEQTRNMLGSNERGMGKKSEPAAYLTRISIKDTDRMIFLKVAEIDAIEAAGKYLVVHHGKSNHLLRESLSAMEAQLDPSKFIRVSRSAIVHVDRILEFQPMFKGEYVVVMQNGLKLTMTRGLKDVENLLKFS